MNRSPALIHRVVHSALRTFGREHPCQSRLLLSEGEFGAAFAGESPIPQGLRLHSRPMLAIWIRTRNRSRLTLFYPRG